jgi:hypothetical protein
MGLGDITRMAIAIVALTIGIRRWYQMVTAAMGKDVMSPKTIATEGHSSDGWFGDITEKSL